jgi:AcrR family transcriptional regulator
MDGSLRSLREKRKQYTKAEIVRVAFDLFGKHGFDKVPVEMICAEAGISRATFFNYFPQKELILREFAHARVAKVKEILSGFTANRHTPGFEDLIYLFRST